MERPAALTEDVLLQAARKCLKTNAISIASSRVDPANADLLGLAGVHSRVELTVAVDNSEKPTQLQFFAKVMPVRRFNQEEEWNESSYRREVNFYGKILPEISNKVDAFKHGIVCECYLSAKGLLILEDLKLKGFKTHDVRDTMDESHCFIVLQTIARFHALSIIFEEKETLATGKPCRIGDLWKTEIDQDFTPTNVDRNMDTWVRLSSTTIEKLAEIINPNILETLVAERRNFCTRYLMMRKPSTFHRNVICQADLWAKNILFQYSNGEPVAAKLVDFQLIQYTPPAYDVLSFIYLSTTRDFRRSNLEKLLSFYYKSLTAELSMCDLEADNCDLSWDKFLRSCKDQEYNARLTAMFIQPHVILHDTFLHQVLKTSEDWEKFFNHDRTEALARVFAVDEKYRNRITDTLEEFFQNCL